MITAVCCLIGDLQLLIHFWMTVKLICQGLRFTNDVIDVVQLLCPAVPSSINTLMNIPAPDTYSTNFLVAKNGVLDDRTLTYITWLLKLEDAGLGESPLLVFCMGQPMGVRGLTCTCTHTNL